ncbi:MAG: carbon storage regulator [Pirellulaceae bacterium]
MLVLSRRVGESFLIGEDIVVTVVRIAGGGVRIGIEAPASCTVVRSELAAGREPLPLRPASEPGGDTDWRSGRRESTG